MIGYPSQQQTMDNNLLKTNTCVPTDYFTNHPIVLIPRCDQSNCLVIELDQTQLNLIERLGSIGSEIEGN